VRRPLAGLVVLALGASAAQAQDSAVAGAGFRLPVRMSGDVVVSSDLYGASGI